MTPGRRFSLVRAGALELAGDNTYDIGHVPVWRRGPIVIIGDAAHAPSPTSGQGASMAAEDGVILAKALRDLPTVASALEAFENRAPWPRREDRRLRRARQQRQGADRLCPGDA